MRSLAFLSGNSPQMIRPMPGALSGVAFAIMAGVGESYVTPTVSTDLTTWTGGNATPTGPVADPDGGTAAYTLTEQAVTGGHTLLVTPSDWTQNGKWSFRFWVKRHTGTRNIAFYTGSEGANFDLDAVTATDVGTGYGSTITSVGGGWFLCVCNGVAAGPNVYFEMRTSVANYAGDGTSALDLYVRSTTDLSQEGSTAQLVFPQYDPPTAVSRAVPLAFSSWTKTGDNAPVGGQTDPDGGTNGWLVTEDTSTGIHNIYAYPTGFVNGERTRVTGYVRPSGSGSARNITVSTASDTVIINPSTGAVVSTTAGVISTSVTASSDGLGYDFDILFPGAGAVVVSYLASGTTTSYAGDGTSGVVLYNFLVEQYPFCYVNSPSDVSNATYWTVYNCTTPDAQTILDSSDTAAQYHDVLQIPPQYDKTIDAVLYAEVYPGTLIDGFLQLSGCWAFVDASAHSIAADYPSGTATVLGTTGDGWTRVQINCPASIASAGDGNLYAGTVKAGANNYIGDGTGSIKVRNVKVTQPSLATDKSLIQTVDQSTFANMPLRTRLSTGVRAMQFVRANASYLRGALAAPIAQPFDLWAVIEYTSDATEQVIAADDTGAVQLYANGSAVTLYAGTAYTVAGVLTDGLHVVRATVQNGMGTIEIDGVVVGSGAVGSSGLDTAVRLGWPTSGATFNGLYREFLISDPTVVDATALRNLLRAWARI